MGTGIDIAGYQANDYSTSGLDYVFVKATEGTSFTNPRHAAQVAHGRERGLVVGHYHFVRPGSMTAQADYFLRQARAKAGDVLAFDWEDEGVTGLQKDEWLRYVQAEAPDNRVILYCNRDFWLNRDSTSFYADGLWIADPSAPMGHPRIEDDWLFHQYSSAGGTDRNYSPLSAAQLHAWAAGTTTVQEDDVQLTDKLTIKKGSWSAKDQTATVGDWLGLANLKAGVAADAATKTYAATVANTAAITVLAKALGDAHANVDTDELLAKLVPAVTTAVNNAVEKAVVKVDVSVTGDDTTKEN